ncbi:hypothetical protein AVO45_01900 [Ruegeria marisrubri]|uniref:Type IV pilus biogenesis n=1 Tax=Ruegeria marisrubri TaxID=1685379 RepID=A0A101CYL9_9RHOB|nr:hypothetical protein [Ruegeria marisrubri]KUJ85761.1 hypothetical protein AVO45_01900 [Ruegeria marisrubri]
MNPAFALSLSIEGIELLHRSDSGWQPVGAVQVDDPDLKGAMRGLRDRALALADDTRCEVIVPNDQIRCITIETGTLSDDEWSKAVESELAGATPYPLSELAFDTVRSGDVTHVAAVARNTLEEARGFVLEHGFQPVGFVAHPELTDFPGVAVFEQSPQGDPAAGQPTRATEGDLAAAESDANGQTESAEAVADAQADAPSPAEPEETAQTSSPAIHPIAEAPPIAFAPQKLPGTPPASEAERLTIFGARDQAPGSRRHLVPIAVAGAVAVAAGLVWFLRDQPEAPVTVAQEEGPAAVNDTPAPVEQIAVLPAAEVEGEMAALPAPPEQVDQDGIGAPALSATDTAVLDALRMEPKQVEIADSAADAELELPRAFSAALVLTEPPEAPHVPQADSSDEIYLTSIDHVDLSMDALALTEAGEFATDTPVDQISLPVSAGARFELDDRGLVAATAEGTLTPDGVLVYLGRPKVVPPATPDRTEPEPEVDEARERLAGLRPRPRPDDLVEQNERQNLGGRSREELAGIRPKLRPATLETKPEVDETPTALAVVRVPVPKPRPANIAVQVVKEPPASSGSRRTATGSGRNSESDEPGSFAARTVKPKAPSPASVARQATLENAINLRRVNLIGVYGSPANRRALVRLPSGRYKKVAVGDRLDGGKVIAIGDSELRYQKGGRNLTLKMPKG